MSFSHKLVFWSSNFLCTLWFFFFFRKSCIICQIWSFSIFFCILKSNVKFWSAFFSKTAFSNFQFETALTGSNLKPVLMLLLFRTVTLYRNLNFEKCRFWLGSQIVYIFDFLSSKIQAILKMNKFLQMPIVEQVRWKNFVYRKIFSKLSLYIRVDPEIEIGMNYPKYSAEIGTFFPELRLVPNFKKNSSKVRSDWFLIFSVILLLISLLPKLNRIHFTFFPPHFFSCAFLLHVLTRLFFS